MLSTLECQPSIVYEVRGAGPSVGSTAEEDLVSLGHVKVVELVSAASLHLLLCSVIPYLLVVLGEVGPVLVALHISLGVDHLLNSCLHNPHLEVFEVHPVEVESLLVGLLVVAPGVAGDEPRDGVPLVLV